MPDSTEQLFRDWLQRCLSSADSSVILTNEACTAFGLFAEVSSNLDDKLALLIQELGPAFTSNENLQQKLKALSCLRGALQGTRGGSISLRIVQLLGNFFLQYCEPIRIEEEYFDDIDEQIRDVAVLGLTFLMKATTAPRIILHQNDADVTNLEILTTCLHLAQTGVERRCAATENEDDNYDDMEIQYRAGLSLLPRSRRSLCFDLLRVSVEVFENISPLNKEQSNTMEKDVVKFSSFVTTCLHGESDPRCLLQLLNLFHTAMVAIVRLFHHSNLHLFPISEYFDAIAPYYPIQFTPPPNNIHGITKEKLRSAILSVMSFEAYDDAAESVNQVSMRSLALELLIETLVPPEEDGPSSFKEKTDALEDLNSFLFHDNSSKITKLLVKEIKAISDALLTIHDCASKEVATNGSSGEAHTSKILADLCRVIVSRIALETERTVRVELWETFVRIPLILLSKTMSSFPSQTCVALAYIANLCSCGGPKTLRLGLECGLKPILCSSLGDGIDTLDDVDISTAVYAVGAFFASAKASIQVSRKEGINEHPHPLSSYNAEALEKISRLVVSDERSASIRIAAIKTIESILLSCPASHFDEHQIQEIIKLIRTLVNDQKFDEKDEELSGWQRCSAEALGTFIGKSLDTETQGDGMESTLMEIGELNFFLQNDVLKSLIKSVGNKSSQTRKNKFDTLALSKGFSFSLNAARILMPSLTESMHASICREEAGSPVMYASTLSIIFQDERSFAATSFQELAEPSITLFEILSALVPDIGFKSDFDDTMSKLHLPPNAEDVEKNRSLVTIAESIAHKLRVVYLNGVVDQHFLKLCHFIGTGLPPLSDSDYAKLSISLPLLSLAMQKHSNKYSNARFQIGEHLLVMDLADLAINAPSQSMRSHASQCMHAYVAYFTPDDVDCYASKILNGAVMVSAVSAIENARDTTDRKRLSERPVEDFASAITMIGLLGSSAAIRGLTSSKTADKIIRFLLDLACNKRAPNPSSDKEESILDLRVFDTVKSNASISLSVKASSCFGLILSSTGGNPLRKQRISHISLKHIQRISNISELIRVKGSVPIGVLASICHIVCAGSLGNIGSKEVDTVVDVVLSGLTVGSLKECAIHGRSTINLVLAALVRLLCMSPPAIERRLYSIVIGAMRAFATSTDVGCKLLALQILDLATQTNTEVATLQAMKPSIVSILGVAMNHSSALLRQAAVEVLNSWYLID